MSIPSVGMNISNINTANLSQPVKDKIENLKTERKNLEMQLKTEDSDILRNKINTIDRKIENLSKARDTDKVNEASNKECQTCKNRKYQDGSDDPGVSFKFASKVNPNSADSAVRGHEHEHVVREQAAAERENKEVISQTVTIKSDICPECGKIYTAGGTTTTVTRPKQEDKFKVGMEDGSKVSGTYINAQI